MVHGQKARTHAGGLILLVFFPFGPSVMMRTRPRSLYCRPTTATTILIIIIIIIIITAAALLRHEGRADRSRLETGSRPYWPGLENPMDMIMALIAPKRALTTTPGHLFGSSGHRPPKKPPQNHPASSRYGETTKRSRRTATSHHKSYGRSSVLCSASSTPLLRLLFSPRCLTSIAKDGGNLDRVHPALTPFFILHVLLFRRFRQHDTGSAQRVGELDAAELDGRLPFAFLKGWFLAWQWTVMMVDSLRSNHRTVPEPVLHEGRQASVKGPGDADDTRVSFPAAHQNDTRYRQIGKHVLDGAMRNLCSDLVRKSFCPVMRPFLSMPTWKFILHMAGNNTVPSFAPDLFDWSKRWTNTPPVLEETRLSWRRAIETFVGDRRRHHSC
jgi:hypothetical protein